MSSEMTNPKIFLHPTTPIRENLISEEPPHFRGQPHVGRQHHFDNLIAEKNLVRFLGGGPHFKEQPPLKDNPILEKYPILEDNEGQTNFKGHPPPILEDNPILENNIISEDNPMLEDNLIVEDHPIAEDNSVR